MSCPKGTTKRHEFNKSELQAKLKERRISEKGRKQHLIERCKANNIPTFEVRPEIVSPGWVGKQKGLLQVLWERGFVDPALTPKERYAKYPVDGQRDNLKEIIPGTALKEILSNLPDFQEEKTLLQHHAESRSTTDCRIRLIRSPKCHPEIAGEGIEYDWAGAKSHYRRAKISEKRKASGFRRLVKKSLASVEPSHRISFSAKAREYMLAYEVLGDWETLPEEVRGGDKEEKPPLSQILLDDIVKRRKSHRGVAKEEAWVKRIMAVMKNKEPEVIVIDD